MSTSNNDHLWSDILKQLQCQMEKQVYDHLFLHTSATIADDLITIAVPNKQIVDLIQHRMRWMVESTASRAAGQRMRIALTVADSSAAEVPQLPDDDDGDDDIPPDSRIAIELINFDPTTAGFVMTSNYAWQFWQPYLTAIEREHGARNTGVAFCLWNTLRSFPAAWQETGRIQWPSIHTLADMVAGGDRFRIRGRNERGQGQSKRRRVIGALEILENQRIVWPRTYGVGKDMVYVFRVTDSLPLLTPGQIAKLSARLQERHALILDRCKLDYEEWEQLALPTLLNEG